MHHIYVGLLDSLLLSECPLLGGGGIDTDSGGIDFSGIDFGGGIDLDGGIDFGGVIDFGGGMDLDGGIDPDSGIDSDCDLFAFGRPMILFFKLSHFGRP